MGNSGIYWIDSVFDACVLFLLWSAKMMGITYDEINVYLFCIAVPLIIVYQHYRIKYLKRRAYG